MRHYGPRECSTEETESKGKTPYLWAPRQIQAVSGLTEQRLRGMNAGIPTQYLQIANH